MHCATRRNVPLNGSRRGAHNLSPAAAPRHRSPAGESRRQKSHSGRLVDRTYSPCGSTIGSAVKIGSNPHPHCYFTLALEKFMRIKWSRRIRLGCCGLVLGCCLIAASQASAAAPSQPATQPAIVSVDAFQADAKLAPELAAKFKAKLVTLNVTNMPALQA